MNTPPLRAPRRALSFILSCFALSASASILMRESFPSGTGGYAANTSLYNKGPAPSDACFGFAPAAKWQNDTGVFWTFTEERGLQFPSVFPNSVYFASGTSAGLIRSEKNQSERALARPLAENLLAAPSGPLYFRVLMTMDAKAMGAYTGAATLQGNNYFGTGLLCLSKAGNACVRTPTRGISFFFVKDAAGTVSLNLALKGASDSAYTLYPLIASITPSETYLCFAEIVPGTGTDSIRAFASPCSSYTIGDIHYNRTIGNDGTIECALLSGSTPLNYLGLGGAYGVNSGFAAVDEIAVATNPSELIPVSATAPVLESPTLAHTGPTEYTVSTALQQGTATLTATLENGIDAPIVIILADSATPESGTISAILPNLTPNTTYRVTLAASNSDGTDSLVVGTLYAGTPTLEKLCDAEEYNYVPGQLRISRAAPSAYPLTLAYTVTPTAPAVAGQTYRALPGTITIPAGESSALLNLVPMMDLSVTEDTSVSFSLSDGFYTPGTPVVSLAIANATPPEGYNTFISQSGNNLGGRASEPGNWSLGRIPTETDHIFIDGFFSNTELIWRAGVNGLPDTVASWTQTTNCNNQSVFYTTYPEADDAFTCFTVTGDCILNGGRWSHANNSSSQRYRLCVNVGGSFTMGPDFTLTTYDRGYSSNTWSPQGGRGAHASSIDGWSHVTGDVYRPRDIGAGWVENGSGGGAVWLEIAGDAINDGTFVCRCSGRGAPGSIYLKAATLSGSGSFGVNGGTSGGRIGIELTGTDTLDFPIEKFNLSGGANNGSIGGGGTLVVKTPSQAYGTLYLNHSRSHTYGWPNKFEITAIPPEATWTFDSIVILNQGMLAIPPTATLSLPNGLASISALSKQVGGLLYAGGTLDLGSVDQTLIGNPTNSFLGWVFQADTPYTFPGNVTIRNGAAIGAMAFRGAPDLTDSNNYARCCVTVNGDLTVEPTGYLFANGAGPDFASEPLNLTGFGGQPALAGNTNLTYGSVFNPLLPGYPNSGKVGASSPGGGALQITVLGDLLLNGKATANADTSIGDYGHGSGGSINIRAATLSGNGSITARPTKPNSNSVYTSGGGGRIAIRLTEGEIGTTGIWTKIDASGFSNYKNGSTDVYKDMSSSAGTVYLQGASQPEGTGLLRIANDGYPANDLAYTPLPSGRWSPDPLSAYNHVQLELANNARVRLYADLTFGHGTIADGCALDLAGYTATFHSFTLPDGTSLAPGSYRADNPLFAGLLLDSSPNATGRLRLLSPNTLILFR